jgi:hypothetical protein
VVDLISGIFTSKERAIEMVRKNLSPEEWETYNDQFVYEKLELDQYHPIPHF